MPSLETSEASREPLAPGPAGAPPIFSAYPIAHGLISDLSGGPFPTVASAWSGAELALPPGAAHFGFVAEGPAELECASGAFRLSRGMYFSANGPARIGRGRGLAVSRVGASGFFQVGGPVEARGRLRYIDGCTDSLLIPPVLKGDACLNLLHLPPGTRQSRHTHPSIRVGLIIGGRGRCLTPEGRFELEPGLVFVIRAEGPHSFHTDGSELLVLAYHPDSDFGPTHEDHPMVNRTFVSKP